MKKLLVILFVGNVLGKQNVSDPGPAAQQILNFKAKYKVSRNPVSSTAKSCVDNYVCCYPARPRHDELMLR